MNKSDEELTAIRKLLQGWGDRILLITLISVAVVIWLLLGGP